jgi:hypothetical protein
MLFFKLIHLDLETIKQYFVNNLVYKNDKIFLNQNSSLISINKNDPDNDEDVFPKEIIFDSP